MTRLCQPSFWLFQYVDKNGRRPGWGYGWEPGVVCLPSVTNRRLHKADLY